MAVVEDILELARIIFTTIIIADKYNQWASMGIDIKDKLVCLLFFLFVMSTTCYGVQLKNSKCQFEISEGVCANITFKEVISRKKDAKFDIYFTNALNERIKLDKDPKIKLWMVMKSGHAHGSETLKITKYDKYYAVDNVWFLMLGKWDIQVEISYKNKLIKGEIPVCVRRNIASSTLGSCL